MSTTTQMKAQLSLLLFILLASCSPLPGHAELEQGCDSTGKIQADTIANPSRGYDYNFKIYLPPCYAPATEPGYPVIYLIPGRGGGINDWFNVKTNEIADQLILDQQIPPFIFVTTETTNNDPYASDIYMDLIPYVEGNFNVLKDRNHRAVAGGSLGGIAAYRLTFAHLDEFASAGMFGSGIISGEDEQVKSWLLDIQPEKTPRVFLNVGEQDPLMLEQAQKMIEILDQFNISYVFITETGDHSYAYWVTNMAAYFRWAAKDW